MTDGPARRLSPDERKAEIMSAAVRLLKREGLDGFSLEAVAREARVAMSLPRHYFGGYRDLLKASTEELLTQVEQTLLGRDQKRSLSNRFSAYLDLLLKNPWGHQVWMRSAEIHPEVDAIVQKARRGMAESMYRKKWDDMSMREQLDARGRIGYVEALVSNWLDLGYSLEDIVVGLIVEAITLPDVSSQHRPKTETQFNALEAVAQGGL